MALAVELVDLQPNVTPGERKGNFLLLRFARLNVAARRQTLRVRNGAVVLVG